MSLELLPLLAFIQITTFTPGPNNISSASMGVLVGYRKTIPYLSGISSGFFVVMVLCAFLSHTILKTMPFLEDYVRWLGTVYILWLAFSVARTSIVQKSDEFQPLKFTNGLVLQLVNPKVVVYGLTIYSSFLSTFSDQIVVLLLSAMGLAFNAFFATSIWALFGAAIRNTLQNDLIRKMVNAVLSLMLVYSAVSLSGVLN